MFEGSLVVVVSTKAVVFVDFLGRIAIITVKAVVRDFVFVNVTVVYQPDFANYELSAVLKLAASKLICGINVVTFFLRVK